MIDHKSLSVRAKSAVASNENDIFVSAASAWEIATKYRLGKLEFASAVADDVKAAVEAEGFLPLPISIAHGQVAGALEHDHKDPFDRMLIAQALLEQMTVISNETLFD